jgi:glycosyltransferase involved in cell wall biosynthesis
LEEPLVSANLSFDIADKLAFKNNVTVISPLPTRPYGSDYSNHINQNQLFIHEILTSYTSSKSNFIGRLKESFSFGRQSSKFLYANKNNIDIIYANTWPIFAQYFLVKTAKRLNIPVVLHIQDIYPESLIMKLPEIIGKIVRFLILPVDRFVLNNVQEVITISTQMKNYLISTRNLNQLNVKVIRNWQNDEHFTKQIPKKINKSDKFIFMFLGSISPSAGIELLIHSFAAANIENSKLIIAGGGSEKNRCLNLAKNYTCEIEFIEVNLEDVPKIQAKADVLLLPLKKGIGKTASPSKLPAYMFSKKPIIASVDIDSDTSRVINESKSGWVIEPENIDMMIDVMVEASLTDKSKLEIKGENGFKYAMKNLSRKNNLKSISNLITKTSITNNSYE